MLECLVGTEEHASSSLIFIPKFEDTLNAFISGIEGDFTLESGNNQVQDYIHYE
jgi:hypothetical protein